MDKFRVLIVDDEEDVRTILNLALTPKYEVVEAHDGLDALDKIERVEPDLVILDVMMPLMDGFETCRSIRKNPMFFNIPVLFLSAQKATELIKEGYDAGASLYLTKPFEPERLAKNVSYAFEQSHAKPRPKRHTVDQILAATKGLPAAPAASPRSSPAKSASPESLRRAEAALPPRSQAEFQPTEARKPATPLRPRVMVVDDENDLLSILAIALGGDFEVTSAQNGIEAVERIVQYQPDIIVLDAMMPKMSGYQLCTSLRQSQTYAKTPIIFVSAKSSPRDQDYCRRLGADDFLSKPFDPETLRQRLLAYASAPDFIAHPKKLTLEQIRAREKSTVEWVDRQVRGNAGRSAELEAFSDRELNP